MAEVRTRALLIQRQMAESVLVSLVPARQAVPKDRTRLLVKPVASVCKAREDDVSKRVGMVSTCRGEEATDQRSLCYGVGAAWELEVDMVAAGYWIDLINRIAREDGWAGTVEPGDWRGRKDAWESTQQGFGQSTLNPRSAGVTRLDRSLSPSQRGPTTLGMTTSSRAVTTMALQLGKGPVIGRKM